MIFFFYQCKALALGIFLLKIVPEPENEGLEPWQQTCELEKLKPPARICIPQSRQSSELGPHHIPSPAGECVPFPFGSGGGTHSLTVEGVGGPNSEEGANTACGTLVVYVLYFVLHTVLW